ncbi:uncharacterized protein SAPINGB_P001671 [Magnusiomyces paraingens]|uniref:Uncharacterized protein n=1 Tax=Magnusiomyces paraingens TaxID=2606893 RepID=A0A5E8B739_9ASCO|nr:uncharacterized protein SAPINGB_P001671 [Saprochaete ingens]VVT47357.1 unnamed protein product [Saprochaete ingens]
MSNQQNQQQQQQQQLTLPRRSTIVPSSQSLFNQKAARRRSTLAPSTFKSRQLTHLNVQLAKLQANMADMDNVLRVTAKQAEYIRKIGLMHASLCVHGWPQVLRNGGHQVST